MLDSFTILFACQWVGRQPTGCHCRARPLVAQLCSPTHSHVPLAACALLHPQPGWSSWLRCATLAAILTSLQATEWSSCTTNTTQHNGSMECFPYSATLGCLHAVLDNFWATQCTCRRAPTPEYEYFGPCLHASLGVSLLVCVSRPLYCCHRCPMHLVLDMRTCPSQHIG